MLHCSQISPTLILFKGRSAISSLMAAASAFLVMDESGMKKTSVSCEKGGADAPRSKLLTVCGKILPKSRENFDCA